MFSAEGSGCLVRTFSCRPGFSCFRESKVLRFTAPPRSQDSSRFIWPHFTFCTQMPTLITVVLMSWKLPKMLGGPNLFTSLSNLCLFSFLLPVSRVQSTNDEQKSRLLELFGLLETWYFSECFAQAVFQGDSQICALPQSQKKKPWNSYI